VSTVQHLGGGRDDRERVDGARQAAEDLFRPRRDVAPVAEITPAPNPPASSEEQPPRRPRIIPIQPVTRTNAVGARPSAEPTPEVKSAIIQQRMPQVLASQFGRVRALTRYGMTGAQVAELYKVPIAEVERIISRPRSRRPPM
jgi:hypothetical protein